MCRPRSILHWLLLLSCVSVAAPRFGIAGADGVWRLAPTLGRSAHTAIFDQAGDRMIVFGGEDEEGRYLNDVWALPLAGEGTWTLLVPDGAPPSPRAGHAAIYDPVRHRMVVTGGFDGGFLEDTWTLSLSGTPTWSEMATAGEPLGLAATPAVYDPVGDRLAIVLISFGVTSVWWLTLGDAPTWSAVAAPGGPEVFPQLYGYTITYDAARGRAIVCGGEGVGWSDGIWAITLNDTPEWTQILPEGDAPVGRSWASAVYDNARDRLVMFGGERAYWDYFNDVWALSFSGIPRWDRIEPLGDPPPPHYGHGAIYDAGRDRMTIMGGVGVSLASSDTWVLSFAGTAQWVELSEIARLRCAAVYDPIADEMVMFGGLGGDPIGGPPRGDTVGGGLGSTSQWRTIATGSGAPARFGHTALYDAAGPRMVVFGGTDGGSPLADLWALSLGTGGAAWSPLFPSGAPPPARFDHSAIRDPLRNRMIVFGGTNGVNTGSDTWSLSLGPSPAWTPLQVAGAPARAGHTAIYDPPRDRMLVFGGSDGASPSSDVWVLPLGGSAWTLLPVAGSPPSPRVRHSAVYDPIRDRMLVFGGLGGTGGTTELNDLWALDLGSGAPSWVHLSPAGEPPGTRSGHVALFDLARDRMLIFGGSDRDSARGDLWSLDLGAPTPVLVSLASVEAVPGRVRLRWHLGDGVPFSVLVQRTHAGSDWATLARASADGTGEVAYEDDGVAPGGRYGYRLALAEGDRTTFGGEAWVDVPSGALSIRVERNPVARGFAVAITLPTAAPATLELVDAGGRRLIRRAWTTPPPGAQRVVLEETARMPAGVYLLRLAQGSDTAVAKACVVP